MKLPSICLVLLATALSGCWVLDELDAGSKKIDMYSSKASKHAEEEEPVALPSGKRQRIGAYFASQKNARTLTKGQMPSGIVSCKLSSGTQFMKQEECLHRGGVPSS